MTEPRRYRIAMVAACPFPTCQGSQVLVRQTAESLARRGHQVHLICYHFGEEIPLQTSEQLVLHRIAYPSIYRKYRAGPSIQKPLLDALMVRLLLKVTRRHRIQVVHAHNYEALLVGLSSRLFSRTPVVFHSHNAISDELSSFFRSTRARRLADRVGGLIDGSMPRRADHVIAINDELERFFLDHGVGEGRISCLPPGIALEEWSERPLADGSPESAALEALDRWLGEQESVALYAGNLDDYQNLPLMFRAFVRVRAQLPQARLVVVSRSDPRPYQGTDRRTGPGRCCSVRRSHQLSAGPPGLPPLPGGLAAPDLMVRFPDQAAQLHGRRPAGSGQPGQRQDRLPR